RGGRCEACAGEGTIKIEMHFLPDVYVPCEVCKGKRYNRETLQVRYKGKNISDVLAMSVAEAANFFAPIPPIARHMETLRDVGLGYIKLGQPAPTLSGGEAQRVKLSTELSKRSTGKTLYILDEPTTGLHFDDVAKLLGVLHRLVDGGNTVVVIEHNLDVIKTADHIVDLGPEGGAGGGRVVAEGTPEEIAAASGSYTGQFLAALLDKPRGGSARRSPRELAGSSA
ncbi:MAG: excinuclease ABC subunit A, partial [Actinobacteria bacterium]|nr:excinuclease ABC subunit A [Actinomycetota bacterium]